MKRSAGTEDARSDGVDRRRFLLSAAAMAVSPGLLGTADAGGAVATAEWKFGTGDVVHSSPTVVDGTLYIGSYDTDVYAIDAETGQEEWTSSVPSRRVHSSPTVVDGTVFVGSADETVYALDAETGEEMWAFTDPSGFVESSPTVADGLVYVGSSDHYVYAIDPATGDRVWEFETGGAVHSSPTVADGTVYIGSDDGTLYALDGTTGEHTWDFSTAEIVNSSPTVAEGLAYVGSEDGTLYALDATDGSLEWRFETDPYLGIRWSSPAVANGRVYVGSTDASLYALDATSGSEEWAFRTDAAVRSSPTVASGTVFVGSFDGNLYALDGETGDQQWRFEASGEVNSSPTVASGQVFVGSADGNVYALDVGGWSSDDSRVRYGTLGHHGDWADQTLPSPAIFEIRSVDHPLDVTQGETTTLGATVANVGDRDGPADIRLAIGGETLHEESVGVPAGEEVTVTADVSIDVAPGDHELTASVAWADQRTTATSALTVVSQPAAFELTDLDAPDEASLGETLDVGVTVTNVGEERGTADLTFELGGASETTAIDLAGGESETVSTALSLEDEDEGAYDLLVQAAWNGVVEETGREIILEDSGGPLPDQSALLLGGGGLLAVLGLGAYGLHRRRNGDEAHSEPPTSPAGESGGQPVSEGKQHSDGMRQESSGAAATAKTAPESETEHGDEREPVAGPANTDYVETAVETGEADEIEPTIENGEVDEMHTTPDRPEVDNMETAIERGDVDDMETTIDRGDVDDMETTIDRSEVDGMETTIDRSEVDGMETTIDRGGVDEMHTTIERDDVDNMETTIDRSELDDMETTIDRGDVEDLKTTVGGAQPGQDRVERRLEEIEDHLDEAEHARDDHRFDDAVKRCEDAIEMASDLLTEIQDEDRETRARAEDHRERATQLREAVQTQKGAHRTILRKLETASQTLDELEEMEEDGEAGLIIDRLDDVEETIAEVEQLHRSHGVPDAPQNTGRLSRRCSALREQATDALSGGPPSGEIPRPPALSLSYEDLTRREILGSGGSADVYRATAETADGVLTVALKEPRLAPAIHADTMEDPPDEPVPGIDSDGSEGTDTKPAHSSDRIHDSETRFAGHLERMLKEAETWQRLDDHDHIVDVIDYGDTPTPWIAMEYMDAGHLGDRAGEMEFDQALWTAIAITKAVRHAHRRGVAHLDLKSENILFRSVEGAWDVPKVADWGLSKHLLQYSKSIEGLSPHYAAPEQFDDSLGRGDDLTDVYQLGTVFYELFTGRPPFHGNPAQVMHKVLHKDVTPPSELADVPPELDDILLTAMAKEKDDRHEAVLVLRNELQALQSSSL